MGYHARLQDELLRLLTNALDAPVMAGLTVTEAQFDRLSECVYVVRESINFEPFAEINPDPEVQDQPETWAWSIYYVGGGGGSRPEGRGAAVDLMLEQGRTALNAQRLGTRCGPMMLTNETYQGQHGTGVMYVQGWTHRRLPCKNEE